MLYEISGNGLKQSSYLFGTQHMVPKEKFIMPKELKEKIKSSKVLVFETDINPKITEMMKLIPKMMLPSGQELKDIMDSLAFSNLEKFILDTLKMSEKKWKQSQRFKPSILASMVMESSMKNTKSYEKEIGKIGKKKKIEKFETLEEQLNMLNSIDDTLFLGQINSSMLKGLEQLTNTYLTFNLDSVQKLLTSEPDYEEIDGKLIRNRNTAWIPKIETFISNNSTFIAVGAGHLPGSNGLIQLLRNKGYTINPIPLKF